MAIPLPITPSRQKLISALLKVRGLIDLASEGLSETREVCPSIYASDIRPYVPPRHQEVLERLIRTGKLNRSYITSLAEMKQYLKTLIGIR